MVRIPASKTLGHMNLSRYENKPFTLKKTNERNANFRHNKIDYNGYHAIAPCHGLSSYGLLQLPFN